ncbi:YcaO-like family protein [Microbacterium aquimaris]|uniref:YcaO-like family protein n=1 Tax=Microbacterium aquimaris TaxID=459816 RepID=A0ABU5N7F5_9MICO|nr:YcaO-like family protein [Microbacterium aquimaris]MDZ8162011.1 YcaO-like family protein [Microbacterium aquimaris]
MSAPSTTATARVEIRALGPAQSLLTTPTGASFTVDIDAATALRMVDAWASGHASPALAEGWDEAGSLLRDVLERDGAFHVPDDAGILPDAPPRWDESDGSDASAGDLLLTGDPIVVASLQQASTRPLRAMPADDWQRVVHRAFRTGELLVFAVRGGDDATLIALDRLCSDARTPWVAVEVTRSHVWVGPFVTPGVGANYEDFAARRTAAAFDAAAHRALRTPAVGGDAGLPPHRLDIAMRAARDILTDERVGDTVFDVSPDGSAVRHPVLPLPDSVISAAHPHAPGDLVDPVTGIVQRTRDVTHHPSIPRSLATAQSDVCNMRRVSRWANNTSCQGAAFGDPEQARASAIGEAAERYCGNLLDTLPVTFASYDALSRGPMRVLDPDHLVLYSDRQYDTPGFPFARMTHDLEMHWVPGRSLTTGEDLLVPASMVYVNWFTAGYSAAPVTNFCPFAGIAAGPTMDYAITSALEEIIERHATMVWWLNAQPLDATDPGALGAVWEDIPAEAGQRPSLIMIDNEFGVPVAAGVLHNDLDTLVNVGFACRDTPEAAALKAWTEACTLQEGSRDLLRADGAHWDAMSRGELNSRSFKPWRADRAYLDSYREDMRDCDDLMVQQQVHLDPRAVRRVAPLLERPVTRTLADAPRLESRTPDAYRRALEAAGHEVIVVDITSPDIASTGMAVVRAIVPGTVGNAPAAFPFLGGGRVQDLAVELGWRTRPLAEDELNHFPIPHA